jgi:hypothetical protein
MALELILNMTTRKEKVRDGNIAGATRLAACFTTRVAGMLKGPLTRLTTL